MRKKATYQPFFAVRGPFPLAIKLRISSVFLALALCCCTHAVNASAETKQQRALTSTELVKGRSETAIGLSEYNAEKRQEGSLREPSKGDNIFRGQGAKAVHNGALKPLDDYVSAKQKINIEGLSTSKGRNNFKGEVFEFSGHEDEIFRKSIEYNNPISEHISDGKLEEFPKGVKYFGNDKSLLVTRAGKSEDTNHGSSMTEMEMKENNQNQPSEGSPPFRRGTMDKYEHQRLKQRKSNRKRGRPGNRSRKGNRPVQNNKVSDFQPQPGFESENLRSKSILASSIPSNKVSSSEESLLGRTPTQQDIDHSHHLNPVAGKGDAIPKTGALAQPERTPTPSAIPPKGSHWYISQSTSQSPSASSGNTFHDDISVSWKRKRGPKGAANLTKERERIWSLNVRENRGRRHLDGKEDGEDQWEGNGETVNKEISSPQGSQMQGGLVTHNINEDGGIGSHRENPMNQPQPERDMWGNYHDAYEGENWGVIHSNEEAGHIFPDFPENEVDHDFREAFQQGNGNELIRFLDIAPQDNNIINGEERMCGCWVTDAVHREVECTCHGMKIVEVPSNFSSDVNRIMLLDAGIDTLRNDSFTRYRGTLQAISLQNLHEFHTIEAGAFRGLRRLRSIYIHSAPMLKMMPNLTFTEDNTKLRSLRIVGSGIERVPNMHFTGQKEIVHMIELDSNRIREVHSRSLKVRVEELSLNYNLIHRVDKEAFWGSEIAKLSLKGNQQLTYLHPEAFEGIGGLRTLDLSETSITSLPTSGLKGLEVLLLKNTPTLKVFPSVYSFKTIEKAYLTYPYHCCAFQFPEQHDREQYISHKKVAALEQENCSDFTSPSPPTMAPTNRVRRRRHAPSLPPTASPSPTGSRPLREPASSVETQLPPSAQEISHHQRLDSTDEDEKWGSVRSGTSIEDDAIILSSVVTRHNEHDMKHRRTRSSDETKQQLDMREDALLLALENRSGSDRMKSSSKRSSRNSKELFRNDAMPQSKTRHNFHRSRHSKPKVNTTVLGQMDSRSIFHESKTSDYPAPSRRQMRSKYSSLRAPSRLGKSQTTDGKRDLTSPQQDPDHSHGTYDTGEFIPVPNKRFETVPDKSNAPLPDGTFGPVPDKRFGVDDLSHNLGGQEEGFVGTGIGGAGGYPMVGFGPFNSTADRYPTDVIRFNDSSHFGGFGGSQSQPIIPGPPLDLDNMIPGDFAEDESTGEHLVEEIRHDRHPNDNNQWHSTKAPMDNTVISFLCGNVSKNYHDVECDPAPDAFNPCEDIMGNLALRVAVWFVVVTAVVGNLAVMLVLVSSKFRMTVSKFLMVNLALADLCMGIYLLIIASMDLHTIGVYFNHAIDWQNGPGCKVAGFLTVFASELSIFTLTVITSERWYAITYAIHLNKRLKLSMAAKIMVIGWIYSITMASLPLVGISGYSKTSICLPMETGDALALAYLISLLLVNGLAFFVITACYASMYCSISRHDASASHSDLTVAKRMALLVFTDFACWAPIAFFGLTAVAGIPLIDVTRAKILLVFFYPLNSCANPYLYAILTKQYRRDLFILLARYGFCTKRAMRYKGAYSSVNNTFPHNTVVNAPNHRNSTLTQITLCDLTRTSRTSQQSNNGSLLGTMIGGSQDSLQRSISPSRTPTKPETSCGDTERLSTVQEMSHSNHSDDDNSEPGHQQDADVQHSFSGVVKQAGSPHPIKNCYTRLSFTAEKEEILKQALKEAKSKKMTKSAEEKENGRSIVEENGKANQDIANCGQGEAIVMCEVEVSNMQQDSTVGSDKEFDELEATSTV